MIEERARVVAVEGPYAWLEGGATACGGCGARGACGTAAVAGWLARHRRRVRALNRAGARPGEEVVVGLAEGALVRGSLLVYLVPLAAMISGAVAGVAWFGAGDGPAAAGALTGLAMALVWLRRRLARLRDDPRFQPVVLRRL